MAVLKREEPGIKQVCPYGSRAIWYKNNWTTWWLTQ